MYYLLIALSTAIAVTDLWIVGGKGSATIVICFFAYVVAAKSAREQKMIAAMSAAGIALQHFISAIDEAREKIEDHNTGGSSPL